MSKYKSDRQWSDQFIEQIKWIVGPLLLEDASFDEDATRATDLIILNARDRRIACRMRRAGYADKYPFEFTIRSERDSGAETELNKMIRGFGDWMFYGHASETGSIARWMVIDLAAWRAHLIQRRDKIKFEKMSNGDGTHFYAFDVRSFIGSPKILVAASHELEEVAA
jgi:hypothetical protein